VLKGPALQGNENQARQAMASRPRGGRQAL